MNALDSLEGKITARDGLGNPVTILHASGHVENRLYSLETGVLIRVSFRKAGELDDCGGLPAVREWFADGNTATIQHYRAGKRHNDSGPAWEAWFPSRRKDFSRYYQGGKRCMIKDLPERREHASKHKTANQASA